MFQLNGGIMLLVRATPYQHLPLVNYRYLYQTDNGTRSTLSHSKSMYTEIIG